MRFPTCLLFLSVYSYARASSIDVNGIYSGSKTPSSVPWNTYNYCNAPHVNAAHYQLPTNVSDSKLVYVNVMIRHHKRTPDNLFPDENQFNPKAGWDCTDFLQFTYGSLEDHTQENARIFHETNVPPNHPFLDLIWNGTCDTGQLTAGGLEDSIAHGKDFADVYFEKLKFLHSVNPHDIYVRTSTEDRTFQVAGGMLFGMDPSVSGRSFKVHTQPSSIDTIVPSYPCPHANDVRNQFQSVPAWFDHLKQNADLKARLDETLGTAGLDAWSTWYDHFFDTFTSRTCHAHPLPCNSTGGCVAAQDAVRVFAIGDFEYNYIWKGAENSTVYNSLTFGGMFKELTDNFVSLKSGTESFKFRLYVGHDGSMIRMASGLNIPGPLRWPALGSEFVIEVWQTPSHSHFVRVMHEGTPVPTLQWMALDDFIALLKSNVPDDLFDQCFS